MPHGARAAARPKNRLIALLGSLLLLAAAVSIGAAVTAEAAVIPGAITSVTVGPNPVAIGNQVTTTINWKVPDGTQAGDTFQLTLDPKLRNLPSSFQLKDANGNVVATAAVSNTTPAVITFSMTAYAASHINVSGTAFVKSNFSADPGDTTFTSTSGGKTYTSDITVTGTSGPGPRGNGNKFGVWTRADQGRDNPADFLQWSIGTPTGPFDSATVSDTIAAPQSLDCATVVVLLGDDSGPSGSFAHGAAYPSAQVTCSAGSLTVKVGAAADHQIFKVRFSVSLPAATGSDSPAQTFTDRADITVVSAVGTRTMHPGASMVQADAGGEGSGTNTTPKITITKGDSRGNAADTAGDAATLPNGTASLVYSIGNTGDEPLKNIVVSDAVVSNGTVTGLSCTFPDQTTGTTWAGPLAVGASFTCTADLSGVEVGTVHEDIGTVTGVGALSGQTVTDHNPYYGNTPEQENNPPTPSTTTPTPSATSTSSAPNAPGSTSPSSDTTPPTLANTGVRSAPLALGIGLAAVGSLLLFLARRRPQH